MNADEIVVVIRAAHERTESLCHTLVCQQMRPEQVHIIHEAPFRVALRRSFQIAVESNASWLVCVDADLLPRSDAIARLVKVAKQQAPSNFFTQAMVYDKFFGGPRTAGIKLYNTALLPEALAQMDAAPQSLRPEHSIIEHMNSRGYGWHEELGLVLAVHDEEQFYRDIFRKCFVQAFKHDYLASLFVPLWRAARATDPDFHAALLGFAKGLQTQQRFELNAQDLSAIAAAELEAAGVHEKPPLRAKAFSVDEFLDRAVAHSLHQKFFPHFYTNAGKLPRV